MSEVEPRRHPEPETLSAFVDGALMGTELKAVSDHLRECSDCRQDVGEAARFRRETEEGADALATEEPPTSARRWWFPAAAAAAIAFLAIGLWMRGNDPMRRLQPDGKRTIQARVAAFDYAPYRPMRGAEPDENWRQMAAAGELQETAEKERTAENLHRYALAEIALGKTSAAVDLLREAAKREPENATILSDLAAAQLATSQPAEAAENAAKALERDPKLAAAAFNWALALETLSNRPAAIKAWEQYLRLDAESEWATEAKEHLADLQAPRQSWDRDRELLRPGIDAATLDRLVATYPQRVRFWAQDDLLTRYVQQRHPEDLALLDAIGEARARRGDPFLRDLAVSARDLSSDFAQGVEAFHEARATTRKGRMDDAAPLFDAAIAKLGSTHSPLASVARIFAASTASYRGRTDEALQRLDDVEPQLDAYPSLGAEAKWVRGLILARLSDHAAAASEYRAGVSIARRCGETEHEVAMAMLIAPELDELADLAEADRYRVDAMRRVDEIGSSPQRLYVAYSESALAALYHRRPHLALAWIDSQETLAKGLSDPLLAAESQTARALAMSHLGDSTGAADALATATEVATKIPTAAMRDRALAETEYVAGTVRSGRDPHMALASLSSAMLRWQNRGWRYHAASARLALGDVRLASGDRPGAERDFRDGIAEMETQRQSLDEPQLRIAYFERADRLFDRLVGLMIDERRYDEALSISERKRARALLDLSARTPLDAAAIRASIAPQTVLVEYALLDRGVAIWAFDRAGLTFAHVAASRQSIADAVMRYRDAIRASDDESGTREGKWLFEQLIAPVAARIPADASLVIIPDDALFLLPFAALVASDGTYLIERHSIAFAPSASMYVRLGEARVGGSVLAVGQPAPRDLPQLTQAQKETEALAEVYVKPELFLGATISPAEFLRRASEASLIAFAGHSADGALLFEGGGSRPPLRLTAKEIAAASLRFRPLVVLAACDTGRGKSRVAEGGDSVANAFLTAGATAVVATLWDVDDEPSARLFIGLHRNIRREASPPAALRDAQLAMLRSPLPTDRRPAAWAGVFLMGSI